MRNYNQFVTETKNYLELFIRTNDPENIASIVEDLMESQEMDIDEATDAVVDIVNIPDEEKVENIFGFIADYWGDTTLSDGNNFGNTLLAKTNMILTAKTKLGLPGGDNPLIALAHIIDIIDSYIDTLQITPGGSYGTCFVITSGTINKIELSELAQELPQMVLKQNQINQLEQLPEESNLDFNIRKQKEFGEISTEHIWKKYIEGITVDFIGTTELGSPTVELQTPTF